jgi:hypothetical protein
MNPFPYLIAAVTCHSMLTRTDATMQSALDPEIMCVPGNSNIHQQQSLSMSFIETAFSHQKEAIELRHKCNIIPAMKKSLTVEDNKRLNNQKAEHAKLVQSMELEMLEIQTDIESDKRKIIEFMQITAELANCAMRHQPISPETMLKCREEVKNADMLSNENKNTDENQDQYK